jgi:hypothetical protein
MRKLLRTLALGSALALIVAWPVAAAVTVEIAEGGIVAGCFTNEAGDEVVVGTVTVLSGTDDFHLTLMGQNANIPPPGYFPLSAAGLVNPLLINNTGPGTYDFEFNTTNVDPSIKSFRVDSTDAWVNPEKSLSFPRDCDTPIDEAPFAILLLVTGGLAALWFASRQMKATAHPTAA